jgi:hypothetical protein
MKPITPNGVSPFFDGVLRDESGIELIGICQNKGSGIVCPKQTAFHENPINNALNVLRRPGSVSDKSDTRKIYR